MGYPNLDGNLRSQQKPLQLGSRLQRTTARWDQGNGITADGATQLGIALFLWDMEPGNAVG